MDRAKRLTLESGEARSMFPYILVSIKSSYTKILQVHIPINFVTYAGKNGAYISLKIPVAASTKWLAKRQNVLPSILTMHMGVRFSHVCRAYAHMGNFKLPKISL